MSIARRTVVALLAIVAAIIMTAPAQADPPALWPQSFREVEQASAVRPDDRPDRGLAQVSQTRPATHNGLDWGDASTFGAAALALALVAGAAVAGVRHRRAAALP